MQNRRQQKKQPSNKQTIKHGVANKKNRTKKTIDFLYDKRIFNKNKQTFCSTKIFIIGLLQWNVKSTRQENKNKNKIKHNIIYIYL